jgi:hypothetical protein
MRRRTKCWRNCNRARENVNAFIYIRVILTVNCCGLRYKTESQCSNKAKTVLEWYVICGKTRSYSL